MNFIKMILKNILRHRLRNILTVVGIAIALMLFGLLRTVITAWYAGIAASNDSRLICRQAASFILPIPATHQKEIETIEGVETVCGANWFGGMYKDKNQFFARIACDHNTLFEIFPEFDISPEELKQFKSVKNSCVIGIQLQERYGLKIGDVMTIEGDIFPGRWEFVVAGIYKPKTKVADPSQMFFRYDYLNDRMAQDSPEREGKVAWFMIKLKPGANAAAISRLIDARFANSPNETKTEDERAFNQQFTSAFSVIITAIQILTYVIIGIIILVLANTMIMSARERTREYAVLRTLGFKSGHIFSFVSGEAFIMTLLGASIGSLLLIPMVDGFAAKMPKGWFPVFYVETKTWILMAVATIIISVVSAVFPALRALRTRIVDGLRFTG